MGGTIKQVFDNRLISDGFIDKEKSFPVIGLHRPYFDKKIYADLNIKEARSKYLNLVKSVRSYLLEIGASQVLIDRMFKSASNEIDLVKASEFRSMFHLKEPFYEEWLIAKCENTDSCKNLKSNDDFIFKNKVRDAKWKEVETMIKANGGGPEDYINLQKNYFPKNLSKKRYEKIITVIRNHNKSVRQCKNSATRTHQLKMFSNNPLYKNI